jgi:hypothetical protein
MNLLRLKMLLIKVDLPMEIMFILDLDQHQHLMDIWFHRQLLVKYSWWRNNPFVYLWEMYNWVRFYLINIFKARSNIPNTRRKEMRDDVLFIPIDIFFLFFFFFFLLSYIPQERRRMVQFIQRLSFSRLIA